MDTQDKKQLIKEQEEQIKGLSNKVHSLTVSLKEAGKNLNLLQVIVDFTEQKVLPTFEKIWMQMKKWYMISMEFVQTKWSLLCSFVATNESCQMFKRKAMMYYSIVVEYMTKLWSQVSPKCMCEEYVN